MTTTLSTLATTPKQAVSTDVLVAQQLQELQHFAEIGRFSASLLHEISNPLTAAILELDPANPQPSLPQARRSLQLLRRYVEAARQQVQQQSPCRPFFAHRQIEQLKRVLKPLAQAAHVDLLLELAPRCRLQGDPVKFQQIIANLIINAIEAYGNDRAPELTKTVAINFQLTARALTIQVTDWGEGIGSEQLPRLFQPFYSTKQRAGHGLGIGLYMVHQYVTLDFGGSLSVTSSRRHGTQFTLTLPLA